MPDYERYYTDGYRAAFRAMAPTVLSGLRNCDGAEWEELAKTLASEMERSDTVAALRQLYRTMGGMDDWDDNLHLADVVNKRLAYGVNDIQEELRRVQRHVRHALNALDAGEALRACAELGMGLEKPGTMGYMSAQRLLMESDKE